MTLLPLLSDLLRGSLDLLYAPVCLGCGGPVSTRLRQRRICPVCLARARAIPAPRCERCWTPRIAQPIGLSACRLCPGLPAAVRVVRSAFVYSDPVPRLVHALKYGGWHAVAEDLAAPLASLSLPADVAEEVRVVAPVPLDPTRLRQRGYNQAERLGAELAARRGWRCAGDALRRTRATGTQTALHPAERRANVAGAFEASDSGRAEVRGEHVLLVDDVWTTGATALACADALVRAGARVVSVVTVARALPELDRSQARAGSREPARAS